MRPLDTISSERNRKSKHILLTSSTTEMKVAIFTVHWLWNEIMKKEVDWSDSLIVLLEPFRSDHTYTYMN